MPVGWEWWASWWQTLNLELSREVRTPLLRRGGKVAWPHLGWVWRFGRWESSFRNQVGKRIWYQGGRTKPEAADKLPGSGF